MIFKMSASLKKAELKFYPTVSTTGILLPHLGSIQGINMMNRAGGGGEGVQGMEGIERKPWVVKEGINLI